MDALDLLKEDHDRFRDLLKEGEELSERAREGRTRLFADLKRRLLIHERMEEEVLYPALRNNPKAHDIVLEGYEEHHVVDLIVDELSVTDVSDERWAAKFAVLKENLEHHMEEEESDMFKKAKKAFDRDERELMGAQMQLIREEEKQSGG